MTPEQKRIELLEARVKSLEETLLYMSNTLTQMGIFRHPAQQPAQKTYEEGLIAQVKLHDIIWDWQE